MVIKEEHSPGVQVREVGVDDQGTNMTKKGYQTFHSTFLDGRLKLLHCFCIVTDDDWNNLPVSDPRVHTVYLGSNSDYGFVQNHWLQYISESYKEKRNLQ